MQATVDELRALAAQGATILNVGKPPGPPRDPGGGAVSPERPPHPRSSRIPIAPDKPVVLYDEKGDGT